MPEQDQLKPDGAHRGDKASLLRHALILQLKLLGDGLRDAMLVPVSIIAALAGLLFRSKDPWLWYREVLLWGHASDQWIDLFDSYRDHADPDFNKLLHASRSRLEQEHNRNRQAEQTDDEPAAKR